MTEPTSQTRAPHTPAPHTPEQAPAPANEPPTDAPAPGFSTLPGVGVLQPLEFIGGIDTSDAQVCGPDGC